MNIVRCVDNNVSFENCCVIDGNKWFFANEFNALCCMKKNKEILFKGIIPDEYDSAKYLISDIKYCAGKIYLIPRAASSLVIYDINQNLFKKVAIAKPNRLNKNRYNEYLKFNIGAIYDGKLYMIPRTYPAIAVFDILNETIEYETEWLDMIEEYIFEEEAYFWADYGVHNGDLVLAGANNECIVKRTFETGNYSIRQLKNDCYGYSGIEVVGNKYFLSYRKNGQIICVDTDKNYEIQALKMPLGFSVKMIVGFSRLIYLNGYIYAIPLWANYLIKINILDLSVEVLKDYDYERGGNDEVATCCAWIEEERLCIDNKLRNTIDVFTSDGKEETIEFGVGKRFRDDYVRILTENRMLMREKTVFSVEHFVEFVRNT